MRQVRNHKSLHSFERCVAAFRQNEAGATMLAFAGMLSVVVLGGAAGLDYARAVSARSTLQSIADASAVYGATQFQQGTAPTAADIHAQVSAFLANEATKVGLMGVQYEPAVVVDDKERMVHVNIQGQIETTFMKLANISYIDQAVAASAQAEGNMNVCVLALNPKASNSIYIYGSANITAPTCGFWTNSDTKGQAIKFSGSGSIEAAGYCSVGDHAIQNFTVSPKPRDYCQPLADPLADWTPPPVPATCDYGVDEKGHVTGMTYNSGGLVYLTPGRYCGGVTINSGDVEFAPGRYFITEGWLRIGTQGSIRGEGVYIHLSDTGTHAEIIASSEVHLVASDDADLRQILVYKAVPKNKQNKQTVFSGDSDIYLDGTLYLPADKVVLSGNSQVHIEKPEFALVADMVEIKGSTQLEIAGDPDFKPMPFATGSRLMN